MPFAGRQESVERKQDKNFFFFSFVICLLARPCCFLGWAAFSFAFCFHFFNV